MLCQFLASASLQLTVKGKHWSRDLIVQEAYLVFRDTPRARNMAIYTDVIVKQLKERLSSGGDSFPFDVTQTRNKFKKCVAECKKTALIKKTAWNESGPVQTPNFS